MRIWYTNKIIFWSNEGNDYLEENKFNEYLNNWTEVSNVKSINWTTHYTANFYATDAFEATYIKVEKANKTYYFFVQNIEFDSSNGKQYYLALDFYYTYGIQLMKALKQNNPLVVFKRKHANRYFKNASNKRYCDIADKTNYLLNIPNYLEQYAAYKIPTKRDSIFIEATETLQNIKFSPSQQQGNEIKYDKTFYITDVKTYRYLVVKPPAKGFRAITYNEEANNSVVAYIPIQNFSRTIGTPEKPQPNTTEYAKQWPADYVVGMVETFLPPSSFLAGGYVKDFYKFEGQPITDDESFFVIGNTTWTSAFDMKLRPFKDIVDDTYNIDFYNNEMMLYINPFKDYSINENIPFDCNYFLTKNNYFDTFSFQYRYIINSKILITIDYTNSLSSLLFTPSFAGDITEELPFNSNVYNNYLLNNVNSMNTGIALAKEQRDIDKTNAIMNSVFGAFTGFSNMVGGVGSVLTGDFGGAGDILNGFFGMGSSIGSGIMGSRQADFNYKSTIARMDAKKADTANKPNQMLDTYGDGLARNLFPNFNIIHYELPIPYKKMVFSDIYFNGYVTNSVYQFNDYDNRISFNYFELGNVYAIAAQYVKLPKQILKDIASKFESGLRIWKTANFDYTMNLDNRENSYVER